MKVLFLILALCVPVLSQIRLGGGTSFGSMPSYQMSELPTPTTGNTCARVTDGQRGVWCDNGTAWYPLDGLGFYRVGNFGGDIQTTLDNLPACVHPGCYGDSATVQMDSSLYVLTKPLLISRSSVTLQGRGLSTITVVNSDNQWDGPTVYVVPSPYPTPETQSSLVTGSGVALTLNPLKSWFYDLRDSVGAEVNGATAFTFDAQYKPTLDTTGDFNTRSIISSSGRIDSSSGANEAVAFEVYQGVNNQLRASMTIRQSTGAGYLVNHATYTVGTTVIAVDGGTGTLVAGDYLTFAYDPNRYLIAGSLSAGTVTIAAPGLLQSLADNTPLTIEGVRHTLNSADNALTINSVQHIALSYDGSSIHLFVAGVVVDTEAAPGYIVQRPWENVTIGAPIYDWPILAVINSVASGGLDAVRLSDSARWTSGFTPPTVKPTSDSHTKVLLNFDEFYGPFVVGRSGAGARKMYLPFHQPAALEQGAGLRYVNLRDFSIHSYTDGGLYVTSTILANYSNLAINFTRKGIYLFDNDYYSTVRDVRITSNAGDGGFAFCATGAAGLLTLDSMVLSGSNLPFVLAGTATLNNVSIAPNENTIYGMVFRSFATFSSSTMTFPSIDFETANSVFVADLLLDDISSMVVVGGAFDHGTREIPNIINARGKSITFTGSHMENGGTSPNVYIEGTPQAPIQLNNITRLNSTPDLATDMSKVAVNGSYSGSVTISDTATEAVVTFGVPQLKSTYQIQLTAEPSASAVIGQPYVKPGTKTTNGFTIKLTAAPGSGNSVVVPWEIQ